MDEKSSNPPKLTSNHDPALERPMNDEEKSNEVIETPELKGIKLLLVMFGLGLAIFLMSLDTSIIATAIPNITSAFKSTSDIGWYGSAYSFSMCSLQPITGKLFSQFSIKVCFQMLLKQYTDRKANISLVHGHIRTWFPSMCDRRK
jgi:hypothetical protein